MHCVEFCRFIQCAVNGVGFLWVQVPPGNWSRRPVAIEAAVEVTKPSEPSMERIARRFREQAGRNVSEHRAGLEKHNVDADPPA